MNGDAEVGVVHLVEEVVELVAAFGLVDLEAGEVVADVVVVVVPVPGDVSGCVPDIFFIAGVVLVFIFLEGCLWIV